MNNAKQKSKKARTVRHRERRCLTLGQGRDEIITSKCNFALLCFTFIRSLPSCTTWDSILNCFFFFFYKDLVNLLWYFAVYGKLASYHQVFNRATPNGLTGEKERHFSKDDSEILGKKFDLECSIAGVEPIRPSDF